ncbi:MAG: hypothetical protein IJW75_00885 [Alphaproteobacteria bacterium]|nr:hypothetical protein [Alphaproteobacteria bacterium]
MSLVLVATVLLTPVQMVCAADDMVSGGNNERNSFPRLISSEVKFEKKHFSNWFGLKDLPDENCIEEFVLAHKKSEFIDYSLYELVCDFELKTLGNDGGITTSTYTYSIDFSDYENGFWDNLLVRFNLKEDYFEHVFDYFEIVHNAKGFQKRDITGKEKFYTYNTVISQADFYFKSKSTGEIGEARRFKFTWNSDFWLQKCTKIDFSWYHHESGIEKEIDSVENLNGVDGINNDYTTGLGYDELSSFLIDLPAIIVRLCRGLIDFFSEILPRLLSVVFPFFPGEFFYYLSATFIISLLVCIWKFVKG